MGANLYLLHLSRRWSGILASVFLAIGAVAMLLEISRAEQPFAFVARALAEPASTKLPAGLCAPSLARGRAANRPQGQRPGESRA